MKFEVVDRYEINRSPKDRDTIVFEENKWDDFGYKTTYEVYVFRSQLPGKHIGTIQIGDVLERDEYFLPPTHKYIPKSFDKLPDNFISLGNEDYYKSLYSNFKNSTRTILSDMNDIAFNRDLYSKYKDTGVVQTSFFRNITENEFKNEYIKMANNEGRFSKYSLELEYIDLDSADSRIFEFEVNPTSKIPSNVHALIGKNGTGKTTVLRNLAEAAVQNKCEVIKNQFNTNLCLTIKPYGTFTGNIFNFFENALYMSFSIFDKFELTDPSISENFNYIGAYFSQIHDNEDKNNNDKVDEGESIQDDSKIVNPSNISYNMNETFGKLLSKIIRNREKKKQFANEVRELNITNEYLNSELYLKTIEESQTKDILEEAKKQFQEDFEYLSSGHKIILLSVAALVITVNQNTLVLIDEPELYLHPPLVSEYIRSISRIMVEANGLCIVATHSPIVLQEIPKQNVKILESPNKDTSLFEIKEPSLETFGENVATLTKYVFKYDIIKSGFYNKIKQLFNTSENIDDLDTLSLGRDAKVFLNLLKFNRNSEKKDSSIDDKGRDEIV